MTQPAGNLVRRFKGVAIAASSANRGSLRLNKSLPRRYDTLIALVVSVQHLVSFPCFVFIFILFFIKHCYPLKCNQPMSQAGEI